MNKAQQVKKNRAVNTIFSIMLLIGIAGIIAGIWINEYRWKLISTSIIWILMTAMMSAGYASMHKDKQC